MPRLLVLFLVFSFASLLFPATLAIAQDDPPSGPRPAHIFEGNCEDFGAVAYSLEDYNYGYTISSRDQEASRAAELGVTYVAVPLATLIAGGYGIDVHEHGQADQDPMACSEIESSEAAPDVLSVGLFQEGGSGAIGIAYLVALADGGTSVVLFLAEEETPIEDADGTEGNEEPAADPTAEPPADTAEPTAEPAEEPTAEPTEEATASDTYVSPTYGYSLTYDPNEWRVIDGPTSEDGDDHISMRSGFATVEVLGTSGISDAQLCVQGLTDYFTSLPTAESFEPLLDETGAPVAGGDATDAFNAFTVNWARDDGPLEETLYVRCIALPPGDAMLTLGLRSPADFYDMAKQRFDELSAGLTLP